MSDNWLWMSAADLGRGIAAGVIEARDLTEVYLAAIEAHPDAERIYARSTPDRARAEADAAAARAVAGLRRGPLDGVPVSWKDLFDSAGVATEAGSALLRGRVPERDAAVLARATRAGLVCLGKTHMSELAFSGLGINPVTATPPNINDPELAPGGSSGGGAASIAFGLAAAAIGSDTGGSARVPAAWNDLVGLKTTQGLLPCGGVVPLCPRFDVVGPLARSVEDASLLLAALAGTAPVDLEGATLEGRRLMVLDTAAIGPTRAEVAAAFESALDRLATGGAQLVRGRVAAAERALPLSACIYTVEAYATWGEAIEARPDVVFHQIRDRFLAGRDYSGADYVRGWQRLEALRVDYRAATAAFDAVLLPTTANMAPNVDLLIGDGALYGAENLLTLRNTRLGNLMEVPAISLPSGTPGIGLMAMAAPFAEPLLLRLGRAIERALG